MSCNSTARVIFTKLVLVTTDRMVASIDMIIRLSWSLAHAVIFLVFVGSLIVSYVCVFGSRTG